MTLPYRLCHLLFRAIAPVMYRRRCVGGLENVPASGAAIFVSNHISYWDPLTLLTYVPRQVFFMSKSDMFNYPVLGSIFRVLDVFGVERDSPDLNAMRHALGILKRGDPIGIYPQGSRAPLPAGQVRSAKGGVLMLAQRSGAPIIPVAISGLETLFHWRFPWFGRPAITVTFGRPILFEELLAATGGDPDRGKLLEVLMGKVRQHLPGVAAAGDF